MFLLKRNKTLAVAAAIFSAVLIVSIATLSMVDTAYALKRGKEIRDGLMKLVPVGAVYHAIGRLWTDITNFGWIGDDTGATPSMEWYGGTGNMYLYQGSIWISGRDPSGTIHCTAGDENEFFPQLSQARIDSFTAANGVLFTDDDYVIVVASAEQTANLDPDYTLWYDSNLYGQPETDDDGDGLVDEDPLDYIDNDGDGLINEDFAAISEEDTYTIYNDLWGVKHMAIDSPLGVEVIERTYAWSDYYNKDFIIFDYEIINVGVSSNADSPDPLIITPDIPQALTDLYLAVRFDADVSSLASGEFWYDDLADYDEELGISYIYDADDPDTPEDDTGEFGVSPGYIYASLLSSPMDLLGRVGIPASHNWWTIDDDPSSDAWKFLYMSNETYASVPPFPYDYRFLQAVGPYDLDSGDTLRVVFSMGVGNSYKGMTYDVRIAKWMAENDFIVTEDPLPFPPTSLVIINWDGNIVDLMWDREYTEYLDGYNVYRGNPEEGPFTKLNSELVTENLFQDPTVIPGQVYFYAVTNQDFIGNESEYSNMVQLNAGAPAPPTGLTASITNSYVELTWNVHSDTTVAGFNVYRSTADTNGFSQLNTEIVVTSTFTDITPEMDSTYYYAVTALNQMGYESLFSGTVQITISGGLTGRGILLIDDDDQTPDQEIDHRFHYMFRHFNYQDWDVSENGIPTTEDLINYSTVIWYTDTSPYSFYYFALPDTSEEYVPNPLPDYLDAGGHLWLMGGEILYYSAAGDTGEIFAQGGFLREYLHLVDGGDAGDDEFTGLISLGVPGFDDIGIPGMAIGTGWPDELAPDVDVTAIYDLGGYDAGTTAGIFYDGSDYTVIFWGVNASFYATNGNPLTLSPIDMEEVGTYILLQEFGESFMENPPPLPPERFYVSGWGDDYIDLAWSVSEEEDALGYNIYRSLTEAGPYEKINSELIMDQHTLTDSLLTNAIEYWYVIRTVDYALQEGLPSPEIMEIAGRPYTPEKPRIVFQSGNNVSFEWDTHPQSDVIGYNLYGRVYGEDEQFQVNDTLIVDTTYSVELATNAYYISLTAVDSTDVESYLSEEIVILLGATLDQGILLIDDFSWTPASYSDDSDIDAKIDSGFMYGFQHTDWDVPSQGLGIYSPDEIGKYSSIILYTNGIYESAQYADILIAYGMAGGNLLIAGYNNAAMFMVSDILSPFGFYSLFYSGGNNYGGMDGNEGSGYEDFHIDLPPPYEVRSYEIVYPYTENTSTIFRVRGLDGDTRSCGVRSEMPGGNVIIIIGQSVVFWDQLSQDTRDFGRYVLETEFGEEYTGIETDNNLIPLSYELFQNYPNPFNPITVIKYGIPKQSDVSIRIFNILGQEVTSWNYENQLPGYHTVKWDGTNDAAKIVGAGLYLYRIQAADFTQTRKMVLLK